MKDGSEDAQRAPSKLARRKKTKETIKATLIRRHNESSDDFEPSPPKLKRRPRATKENIAQPQQELKDVESEKSSAGRECREAPVPVVAVQNGSPMAPCPLCGRTFGGGQAAQRGNHLRGCGAKRGLSTEQLLEINRLETRQAKERKALGLPALTAAKPTGAIAASKKKVTKKKTEVSVH